MTHDEFVIGERFYTATGPWVCTDKGSRTIIAIPFIENWMSGPPHALEERVFDEHDIQGCFVSLEN